ncbi:SPOR domain-containing protein [Coralliovum pocilloporae]|uniref:SPOR domain-containing protein n=1 Tax=Coralliovum pocilloporae TaxID=3066369 RepID=UPI003306FF52
MIDRKYQDSSAQAVEPAEDPLAELARIVSESDPYAQQAAEPLQQASVSNAPVSTTSVTDQITSDLEAELFEEVRAAYDSRATGQAAPQAAAQTPQSYADYSHEDAGPGGYDQAGYDQGYAVDDGGYQQSGHGDAAQSSYYQADNAADAYSGQEQGYYSDQPGAYEAPIMPQASTYGYFDQQAGGSTPQDDGNFGSYAPVDLDSASGAYSDDQDYDAYEERSGVLPPHSDDVLRSAPVSENGGRKALFAAGAVLAVLVIGVGGVFAYRSSSVDATTPPPIIKADTSPVKAVPDDPGGKEIPHQNKAIYDRVGGDNPNAERLVSSEEKPIDLNTSGGERSVTRVISLGGDQNTGTGEALPGVASTSDAGIRTGSSSERIGPKKVRTVIVKPDGTIVGNEPSAPKPISTTTVAAVTPTTPETTLPSPVSQTSQVDGTTAAANELLGRLNDDGVVEQAEGTPANVPIPLARPTPPQPVVTASVADTTPVVQTQPVAETQSTVTTPAAPTAPVAETTTPELTRPATGTGLRSGYVVQVSSQRSEDQARNAYSSLQRRYPGLLAVQPVHIQPADLGDRGVYYRAGVGPMSTRAEAIKFCENLKAAGADCLVRRVQ